MLNYITRGDDAFSFPGCFAIIKENEFLRRNYHGKLYYYAPTKVVFGRGVETQAGNLAKAAGAHTVLVHYGSDRIQKTGLLDRVVTALKAADLKVVTLGGVVPNPELGLIRQGIALAREQQVDFILAIGGGSVIDSAKAIALGALDDGDVWELYATNAASTVPCQSVVS